MLSENINWDKNDADDKVNNEMKTIWWEYVMRIFNLKLFYKVSQS